MLQAIADRPISVIDHRCSNASSQF